MNSRRLMLPPMPKVLGIVAVAPGIPEGPFLVGFGSFAPFANYSHVRFAPKATKARTTQNVGDAPESDIEATIRSPRQHAAGRPPLQAECLGSPIVDNQLELICLLDRQF